jgi:hypothetical protein
MAPLQGLTGLYADPQDTSDTYDEGVLEARAFTLDADHGTYGSQSLGYQGTVPSESPYAGMGTYEAGFSDEYETRGEPAPGRITDRTPDTHRSPYPRGIIQYANDDPDGLATAGKQMRDLHGPELGGTTYYVLNSPAGREEQTHYTTDRYDAPNDSYQATVTQGQLKAAGDAGRGGYGGRQR